MPRIATRAIIMHDDRLLVVNAWKGSTRLWCAPGGGVENQSSLPENLRREVMEECGLDVNVGQAVLVNEFYDPRSKFHQVEVFFRCDVVSGDVSNEWLDPEGVVFHRKWVTRDELAQLPVKPDSLGVVAWDRPEGVTYDPLEPIAH